MNTQPIYSTIDELQTQLLALLTFYLNEGYISQSDVSEIAKDFLSLLPITNQYDLYTKLACFAKKHEICRPLFLLYAMPIDTKTSKQKSDILATYMQQNATDRAYYFMEGGFL